MPNIMVFYGKASDFSNFFYFLFFKIFCDYLISTTSFFSFFLFWKKLPLFKKKSYFAFLLIFLKI